MAPYVQRFLKWNEVGWQMDARRMLLKNCLVRLDPAGDDLISVINTLADAVVAAGRMPASSRDAAVQAVLRREQSSSTVMPGGIAFPHGRTDAVPDMTVVLGVFREGVGVTDSQSGERVWLVALMFVPLDAAGSRHITLLAHLSRRLLDTAVVARLRAATRAEDVHAVLCEDEPY